MGGHTSIDVSSDFNPIQTNLGDGLLMGNAKKFKYFQWNPMANQWCVINIMNRSNVTVFSARFVQNMIVINKRIKITQAAVEHRNEVVPNHVLTPELTLKVGSENFDVRIRHWLRISGSKRSDAKKSKGCNQNHFGICSVLRANGVGWIEL